VTQGEVGEKHLRRIARWKIIIIILFVTLIVTIAVAAAIGPIPISPIDVYKIIIQKLPFLGNLIQEPLSPVSREVVLIVRLPRVLAAALVGVALSTSGTTLQGLLRNPMADPYIIGVSAGASLGATIAMALSLGFSLFGALYAIPLAAFVGALGTVFLVYTLSRNSEGMSMLTLLLIGIAVTSFFSAIVTLIRLISSDTTLTIVFWLLGSLNLTTWNYVYLISPLVFIGLGVMLYFARDLNSIALGEDQAKHLGVEIETLKQIMLVCVSLMTAAAVSISGIIGFIGLIIPHIMRLLVGPDHRILIPASALAGAIVLIACDTIARTVMSPSEVPVGIITALLGGPFFIYLLTRKKNRSRYNF
jgi:iron complex transport system permease protein